MRVRTLSLVIMLGQGITEASGIAVAILLVRIVDQATFGSYRRVLLVFTTLAALLSLQLDQSLCYFVPKLAARARPALLAQTLATATALALAASVVMLGGCAFSISACAGMTELSPYRDRSINDR